MVGEFVDISNLGKFMIVKKNTRIIRNPKTGSCEKKNKPIAKSEFLFKTQIKHSDTFAKNTVKLDTIWTNPAYWRQKQAYKELIVEIM